MSEPLSEGESAIFRDGERITCVVRVSVLGRMARFFWRMFLAFWLVLGVALALRPARPTLGPATTRNEAIVGYIALATLVLLFVALMMESWRRWQARRTVFDLAAGAVLDAAGGSLSELKLATISVRPYERSTAARFLLVVGVITMLLAVVGGTPAASNDVGLWEVTVSWPGGARVLCEPCTSARAQELAAKLAELGLPRS
jgi:hypothetical protein